MSGYEANKKKKIFFSRKCSRRVSYPWRFPKKRKKNCISINFDDQKQKFVFNKIDFIWHSIKKSHYKYVLFDSFTRAVTFYSSCYSSFTRKIFYKIIFCFFSIRLSFHSIQLPNKIEWKMFFVFIFLLKSQTENKKILIKHGRSENCNRPFTWKLKNWMNTTNETD